MQKTESFNLDLQGKQLTLNEFLDRAIETVGTNQIFEYSALQGKNCQNFVVDVLNSNGILTREDKDFTLQDLKEHTKNSKFGDDTAEIIKGATDVRNAIDNLTGFGVKKARRLRNRLN